MSDYKSKEEQEKLMKECDHIGKHGGLALSSIGTQDGVLLAMAHNCKRCGHNFVNIHPMPFEAPKGPAIKSNSIIGGKN